MSGITTELRSTISSGKDPAIILQTKDSETAVEEILEIARELDREVFIWNRGRIRFENSDNQATGSAFDTYRKSGLAFTVFAERVIETFSMSGKFKNTILVLENTSLVNKDGGADDALIRAFIMLRTCDMEAKTVVLLAERETPVEFSSCALLIKDQEEQPSRRKEVEAILDRIAQAQGLQEGTTYVPSLGLTNAALGLTTEEVKSAARTAIAKYGRLTEEETEFFLSIKKAKIQGVEGLIYHETGTCEMGGLDVLKQWLKERRTLYSDKAKQYGLVAPKGIFLVGPPGTGKSLAARFTAQTLKMSLFELDHSRLLSKYVGEGEKITQGLFESLNTIGPAVLWIDEIEKILPAASNHVNESTLRLTGMLLTWLQERPPDSEIFLVCTSNNPEKVPIELLRSGRIDRLFHLDLPSENERKEIIKIHLNRIHKHLSDGEIDSLCAITDGFSGAEIAAGIDTANLKSYLRDKRFLVTDVREAFLSDPPLSKRNPEMIEMQCSISKQYGVSASTVSASPESQHEQNDTVIVFDYMYQ